MSHNRLWNTAQRVAVWIPVAFLVFGFTKAGLAKLGHSSGWVIAFHVWRYPDWFRVTIGVVEISAALCLLWPPIAPVGASLIVCVMLGAEGTHILKDHGRHMSSEVVPLALAAIVLYTRRREIHEILAHGLRRIATA